MDRHEQHTWSQNQTSWNRTQRACSALAFLLVGCAVDPERPTTVAPVAALAVSAVTDSVLEFSADQEVRTFSTDGLRDDTGAVVLMHIVRRRDPRGGWLTEISREPVTTVTDAGSDSTGVRVAVSDLSGDFVVRNRAGDVIRTGDRLRDSVRRMLPKATPALPVPTILASPVPRAPASRGARDPEGWLASIVFQHGSNDVRNALVGSGATRTTAAGTVERYVRTTSTGVVETSVDPASGVVIEENILERQVLTARAQYRYQALGSGELIRVFSRHEVPTGAGSSERRVIEITSRNMTLTRVSGAYK